MGVARWEAKAATLPEINSEFAPENGWLGHYFPFWEGLFLGAMLALGSVIINSHDTFGSELLLSSRDMMKPEWKNISDFPYALLTKAAKWPGWPIWILIVVGFWIPKKDVLPAMQDMWVLPGFSVLVDFEMSRASEIA